LGTLKEAQGIQGWRILEYAISSKTDETFFEQPQVNLQA
jgi:hypothetical protein